MNIESKSITSNDNIYKRNFMFFAVSRLVSDLGSAMFRFALSLYVLDLTGSAAMFSMIMGCSILPGVVVNILAGVYVDRHNKKKMVVLYDLVSGGSVFLFLAIFNFNSTNMMLFIIYSIILSALQAMFLLALNASIPNIAKKENVAKFNSTSQGIGAIVNVAGPVIGALLYNALGLYTVIIIDGLSFILAGLLEIALRYDRTVSRTENKSYFESFKDVWKYLGGERVLQYMLITVVIINFILSPLVTIVLQYVNYHELKVSPFQLSLIQASWFAGVILGAVIVSTKKSIYGLLRKWFILIQAQAVLIILWVIFKIPLFSVMDSTKWTTTGLFCLLIAITGICNGLSSIPALSFIQIDTPERIRAGIIGVVNTACLIAVPLGMWIYGALLENVNWVYATSIPGITLMIFVGFASTRINLREYFDFKETL